MTTRIEYWNNPGLIEIVLAGNVTPRELREVTSKSIAMSNQHRVYHALIDASEQERTASLADLYELPASQYEAEGLSKKARIALVAPRAPALKDAVEFYVNACNNRGWRTGLFQGRDEAIAWLTAGD